MKCRIAIIPARGGSKGIPRKNLQLVGGQTLISRAISCARSAGVSEIFVSTDDEEIASVAQSSGAQIIMRPTSISCDQASSESALLHALSTIESRFNFQNLQIAFLQATSPFTNARDLQCALRALSDETSIFSAVPFHNFLWKKREEVWETFGHDRKTRIMRQNLVPTVMETGNFYCFNAELFVAQKTRFCGDPTPFIVQTESIFQIDSVEDLALAQKMLSS